MSNKMKFFTKTTAALIGGAVLLSAAPASAQINSISDLLNKVRSDSAATEAANRDREAKFRQRRDQQAGLLAEARRELAQLERKAASVQSTFDANGRTVASLEGELRAAQGDFGEVFGLSDQLNAIWQTMLQEIKAQRQVATFEAPVANVADGASQSVTRVGPFSIFTAQNADFLQYTAPSGDEGQILLAKLPRQPGGAISSAASNVANSSGGIVYAPIDPTRGELLKSFERVPDTSERIAQGGTIGKIILILLAIGVVFGVLNIIRLALAKMAIGGQKRKAQPSKSNALSRIMMAYDGAKNKDADTVELKLDEAILRESPKFEFGLNFLKLAAGRSTIDGWRYFRSACDNNAWFDCGYPASHSPQLLFVIGSLYPRYT